tara:strand:+ start:3577 stop:3954 length:378 start_codon:yes stop_codon:yes gene_type:complete
MQNDLKNLRMLVRKYIIEAVDQNKDGENDFADVKIARMKASGMSVEKIRKKHPELFEDDYEADEPQNGILGEPDLSSEDERNADEYSAVGAPGGMPGAIRGYQAPLGYSHQNMKGYGKKRRTKKH